MMQKAWKYIGSSQADIAFLRSAREATPGNVVNTYMHAGKVMNKPATFNEVWAPCVPGVHN